MKRIFPLLLFAALLALGYSTSPYRPRNEESLRIRLRWNKAYPAETAQHLREGMAWTLSHLGAALPKGSMDKVWKSTGEPWLMDLDLGAAGFSGTALDALETILDSLKNTNEYQRFCSIDIGRFVVLTVHSPHHYYKITGVPRSLASFRVLHRIDSAGATYRFPVLQSSIAVGNRIVEFRTGDLPTDWAFLAAEGVGKYELGNFVPKTYEVFDIMPNGQLRFAVYDENGHLETSTPEWLGEAGKPGNCMWCHESTLQVLFRPTPDVPGGLTAAAFVDTIKQMKKTLLRYQLGRKSEIKFDSTFAHVQHELLYTTFMEPSAARLAQEWELPLATVVERIGHLPRHNNSEFHWMGQLYHRKDVEALAPCQGTAVPYSVRQPSAFEPDFFGPEKK